MEASFGSVIREHIELQRRNRRLDTAMPLDRYRDPRMENHSLFTPETSTVHDDAAQLDEWPTREREPLFSETPEDLWAGPPSFDWGE